MRYRVVRPFTDLQDGNYAYNTGDSFPRDGMTVTMSRINELLSTQNKRGTSLIEAIEDKPIAKAEVKETEASDEKLTEDILETMTTKEIKTLAAERGYKITKMAKYDVIEQFLNQQG